MWRANLSKSIKEIRFVLKQDAPHHGVWHFVKNELPLIKALNPRTHFIVAEIHPSMKVDSSVYFIFGDKLNTRAEVPSNGLTSKEFEEAVKEKVKFGASLAHREMMNNDARDLPTEVVEAAEYVEHFHDAV